jgi:vesicle transport through interaction with t-SNAREs protein 1
MLQNWISVSGKWNSFKTNVRNNSFALGLSNQSANQSLSRGISILERTNESVMRAEMVARESESIGTEVINNLGEQRESLVRTRERLDGTNDDLKKTRVLLRSINRRLLTNKCLLIFIILLEITIILVIVYMRFIKK